MGFIKPGALRRSCANFLLLFCFFSQITSGQDNGGTYERVRRAAIKEYSQGHFGEAETLFLHALHLAEGKEDDYSVALSLSGLGDVYQNQGHFEEAESAYRNSLSILKRVPDSNLVLAVVLHNLADAYTAEHRYQDSLATLNEASRTAQKANPSHDELTGLISNSFGVVYFYQGKNRKAESCFEEAINVYSTHGIAFAADMAQSVNNLGELYRRRRQFQKAEDSYKKSIRLTEQQLGASHPDLTVILENLADLYTDLKRYTEAEALYRRSLAILEEGKPPLTVRMIHTLHGLSRVYIEQGDKTQAEVILARVAELIGPHPSWNPEIPEVLEAYAKLLKSVGKPQHARDLHGRAARTLASMTLTVRVQDLK
jgi:tetratricopeptide (TPR) repeat protein